MESDISLERFVVIYERPLTKTDLTGNDEERDDKVWDGEMKDDRWDPSFSQTRTAMVNFTNI